MVISHTDGKFQASYWLDAAKVADDPDGVEYSDFLMELKDRIQKLFRRGQYAYAAIFQWNAELDAWELLEEFEPRIKRPKPE